MTTPVTSTPVVYGVAQLIDLKNGPFKAKSNADKRTILTQLLQTLEQGQYAAANAGFVKQIQTLLLGLPS